eukprot:4880617-Pyramimonas_sp.AAC.1
MLLWLPILKNSNACANCGVYVQLLRPSQPVPMVVAKPRAPKAVVHLRVPSAPRRTSTCPTREPKRAPDGAKMALA